MVQTFRNAPASPVLGRKLLVHEVRDVYGGHARLYEVVLA